LKIVEINNTYIKSQNIKKYNLGKSVESILGKRWFSLESHGTEIEMTNHLSC
jgi:hypothetical protein